MAILKHLRIAVLRILRRPVMPLAIVLLLGTGLVALGVFLLATVIPVWRASKVPPMEVLRNE